MNDTTKPLRFCSFGAGVQSSTVALLMLNGEIEPFDHVIFADTGDEPASVYTNMKYWRERFESSNIPFHVVGRSKSISADLISAVEGQKGVKNPPLFVKNPDTGELGILNRKCTQDHKIVPIMRQVKQILGIAGRRHNHITDTLCVQIFGISLDEVQRMRDPKESWIKNSYPLVDLRMTRQDCLSYIARYPEVPTPARSACFHCPYHSNDEWRRLRDEEPVAFAKAVELDTKLRTGTQLRAVGVKGIPYLHSSGIPLDEVDLDTSKTDPDQLSLWGDECAGICGV
jgi:hypothetical protein